MMGDVEANHHLETDIVWGNVCLEMWAACAHRFTSRATTIFENMMTSENEN
jgi:hypothetical protein